MNTIEQNAEIAVTTARGLRALLEMAEQINDGKAVSAALVEKQAELKAVKDEVEWLKKDATEAEGQTRKMLLDAKSKVAIAKDKADDIVAKAEAKAKATLDEAAANWKEVIAGYVADVENAKVELAAIEADIVEKQAAQQNAGATLDAINAAVAEARAKLGV